MQQMVFAFEKEPAAERAPRQGILDVAATEMGISHVTRRLGGLPEARLQRALLHGR